MGLTKEEAELVIKLQKKLMKACRGQARRIIIAACNKISNKLTKEKKLEIQISKVESELEELRKKGRKNTPNTKQWR